MLQLHCDLSFLETFTLDLFNKCKNLSTKDHELLCVIELPIINVITITVDRTLPFPPIYMHDQQNVSKACYNV